MTEDWAVIFDFGNALADDTWMATDLGVFSDWPDVYRRVVGPLQTDWGPRAASGAGRGPALNPTLSDP